MGEKIFGWGFAILVIGGILWWKFSGKSDASVEYEQMMLQMYSEICETEAERDYLVALVDMYHDDAFDDAYDIGGRRRSASMDEVAYCNDLHASLADHLTGDGQDELLARCEALHLYLLTEH